MRHAIYGVKVEVLCNLPNIKELVPKQGVINGDVWSDKLKCEDDGFGTLSGLSLISLRAFVL